MINEEACKISVMSCKNYMPGFDVMYIDMTGELRFAKYRSDYPVCRDDNNKYSMAVKDNDMKFDYITMDRALCFYDRDLHRWCSKVSNYRAIYWQVLTPADELFIDILSGIAIDELHGTCLSIDDITSRIKSRFMIWYDDRYKTIAMRGSWTSRNTIKVPDSYAIKVPENFFYDSEYASHVMIRAGKPNPTTYQLPQPKFVQVNGIFTTVVWKDGTHTVVKLHKGDQFDIQTAVLYATIKRMCANNGCEMDRYLSRFSDRVIFKKETDYDRNEETYAKKDN